MQLFFFWTGWLITLLALIGAAYGFAAACLAGRLRIRQQRPVLSFPPLTILKPLHLDEPRLAQNLESFCRQDYPAPIQIIFGVQDPLDPAIKVVEALQRAHPELDIALVIDTRLYGTNRKVSNLINLVERAKYDVLVQSDSDISVGPGYLRTLIASLAQADGGAVTCLYTGQPLPNVWSKLVAMGINYQFIPNVLVGTALGLATPCFGSTIALRKNLLARIGGMEAFSNLLADDYAIGHAVREHGFHMELAPVVVAHTCTEKSADEVMNHELRWARTIRMLNTYGYWGSVVTHAIPLALIGVALNDASRLSLVVLVLTLAARLAVKFRTDAILGVSAGPAYLLPVRDVLSFVIFLGSLFGGNVRWRGGRFLVAPDGVLSHW